MKKLFFPVFDYLFEHEKARIVAYYALVCGLVFFMWPLIEDGVWRFFGASVVAALLHMIGVVDGAKTVVNQMEK